MEEKQTAKRITLRLNSTPHIVLKTSQCSTCVRCCLQPKTYKV